MVVRLNSFTSLITGVTLDTSAVCEIFARKVEVWKQSGMQVEENSSNSCGISLQVTHNNTAAVLGPTPKAVTVRPLRSQDADDVQLSR